MKNFNLVDTHMHTIASGHAYNTLDEMLQEAARKQMDVVCITEHGPAMPGAAHQFYYTNMRILTKEGLYSPVGGHYTHFIKGMEANIIDYDGNTDYDDLGDNIADLKYVIASFHPVCLEPGSVAENTNAYIGAIRKPYTMTLGHIDDNRVPCDYEKVVQCAKENDVLVEVNNSSLAPTSFRIDPEKNILEYLAICKEKEAKIILNSDAHYRNDIGNLRYVIPLLEKVNFPEELIMNQCDKFLKWFHEKYEKRLALTNAV